MAGSKGSNNAKYIAHSGITMPIDKKMAASAHENEASQTVGIFGENMQNGPKSATAGKIVCAGSNDMGQCALAGNIVHFSG